MKETAAGHHGFGGGADMNRVITSYRYLATPWLSSPHLQSPGISTAEYLSMMKRLGDLEEKVIILTDRPVEMPPEKEEMLNNALNRIEYLEIELAATKQSFLGRVAISLPLC